MGQQRFMDGTQELEGELVPTYHGSRMENYGPICARGLLVPGRGNELRVVNGAAHGRGIYTARVGAPSVSMGFCSDPKMLVCGVMDDADPLTQHQFVCGGHNLFSQSQTIKHVGDAVVVFDERRIVPLFEVSAGEFCPHRNYRIIGRPAQSNQSLLSWKGNKALSATRAAPPALISCGKNKVYHAPTGQFAFMPPLPADEGSHGRNQKRIYEKKVWQKVRRMDRDEKATYIDASAD